MQITDADSFASVLKEDPTEVREDSMDYQIAAPMDDVDPYADYRQFKTSI